jgi:hypothetical protein
LSAKVLRTTVAQDTADEVPLMKDAVQEAENAMVAKEATSLDTVASQASNTSDEEFRRVKEDTDSNVAKMVAIDRSKVGNKDETARAASDPTNALSAIRKVISQGIAPRQAKATIGVVATKGAKIQSTVGAATKTAVGGRRETQTGDERTD